MTLWERAVVLGLGKSGKSAARHLLHLGWQVTAIDHMLDRETGLDLSDVPKGCHLLGQQEMRAIEQILTKCSRLIISPGIDLAHPVVGLARALKIPVQAELELGAEAICKAGTARALIAVTGSNGKTTTVKLLEHILLNLGQQALSAGNIGTPLTSCVRGDASRVIIVEVSSFQLETMRLPLFDLAVLLNITPNHLDRHGSLSQYGQLKCKVQRLLRDESQLLVSQSVDEHFCTYLTPCYRTFGARCSDAIAYGENEVMIKNIAYPARDLFKGLFDHDIANFCAALGIASQLDLDPAAIISAARAFHKPPHRLEWVCSHRGIDYFDDSKATSPDAVIKAVTSLKRPIILIAGGVSKKVSFAPWILALSQKVRAILVMGEVADQMLFELKAHFSIHKCFDLRDAVNRATAMARDQEAILLSPGCSSFDMFKNYQDRGRQFAALAKQFNDEVAKR